MDTLRLSWPRAAHERAAYYVDHSSCFRTPGGTPPAIAEGLAAGLSRANALRTAMGEIAQGVLQDSGVAGTTGVRLIVHPVPLNDYPPRNSTHRSRSHSGDAP